MSEYIAGPGGRALHGQGVPDLERDRADGAAAGKCRAASDARGRERVIAASVRGVAQWLGDTPAVARAAYIDPRLISRYESDGVLAVLPRPAPLPAAPAAETAVAALLAAGT